jgi:manganese oxidase
MDMLSRRGLLMGAAGLISGGAALLNARTARASESGGTTKRRTNGYTPVVMPNGRTLPYRMDNGVKEFHLIAEPVEKEFAPGMKIKSWGYNGSSPGPMIEAVEGDRVRLLVTNRLPEHTTIHWHGILLPSGMDGVGGVSQPHIKPGETYAYEFTLKQHGTHMYHPHADEMVQLALGMMGLFVIHPRAREEGAPDRDFAIMLHEQAVHPGTYRPDPSVMLDFNTFSLNGKVFPATEHLVAKLGERVRIRFGNLSMNQHPMHLHGFKFEITGTDGGLIPKSARWPVATVPVPVGSTRDIEFVADEPGDWVLHCHKSHHTMNAMGHDVPNLIGVNQEGLEARARGVTPGYMAMGEHGMAEHAEHAGHMPLPENTIPMMMGEGPHGPIEMGGMFTVLKVREGISSYEDPGWYENPPGTQARRVEG